MIISDLITAGEGEDDPNPQVENPNIGVEHPSHEPVGEDNLEQQEGGEKDGKGKDNNCGKKHKHNKDDDNDDDEDRDKDDDEKLKGGSSRSTRSQKSQKK